MNLKLILIVSLLVLIFTSLLIFGFIAWGVKGGTKTASEYFTDNSTWFYAELGVQATALVVAGLLFLKR